MEFFREIGLMKNTKKTILKNLTVKTGEKRRSQRYIFPQLATNGNLFDFKICSRMHYIEPESTSSALPARQKDVTQS